MDIYPAAEAISPALEGRPVTGSRPCAAACAASWGAGSFSGETLYALRGGNSPVSPAACVNAALRAVPASLRGELPITPSCTKRR